MTAAYLLSPADGSPGAGVSVTGDAGLTVVEVAAHGLWSAQLGDQVSAAVHMCLTGPPVSVVVDLRDMGDPNGASLPFWLALWQQARFAAAPVRVSFCLPATTALSRRIRHLQGPQPTVYATLPQARAAIAERTPRADRRQSRLGPEPASVGAARAFVAGICHTWDLGERLEDTCLIVSELVANAVEHAGTDLILTLVPGGTGLHLAVHDGSPAFPRLPGPQPASARVPLGERGRGLLLVDMLAAGWGAVPTRDGKVVWATVT